LGAIPVIGPANLQVHIESEERMPTEAQRAAGDAHLRSGKAVLSYHIEASDHPMGHVSDFLFDEETWAIRYLIADTRNFLPGKHVLVAPRWIREVDWGRRSLNLALTRRQIENSPEYDPEHLPSPEYEKALHRHYARPDSR
jgi:hypothetical protein